MNPEQLAREIARMTERTTRLREEALRRDETPLLHRTLAELSTSLEELRVVEQELRDQNAQLVRSNAALEAERRRFASLFDRAPVGYVVTDATGTLREVNQAACTLLDEPRGALVGKPFALLIERSDRGRWTSLLDRVRTAAGAVDGEELRLAPRGEASQTPRQCRLDGALESGSNGTCLWILEDVGARALARQSQQLAAEALRNDEFLAVLGHELRNPIAPIRAAVELWRSHHGQLDATQLRRTVDVVSRQADHLTRLVDEILDQSRVMHGKIDMRREVVDLRDLIEQTCDGVRGQAQHHVLEAELPPERMPVDGDPVRLRQVFANLIDNALKFTPRGGRVVVRARVVDDHAEVSVRDDGQGMAPDVLARIFAPFAQAATQPVARPGGGLGLGLALVRRLVELHGGTVAAQSEGLGHGSEIVVILPLLLESGEAPAIALRDEIVASPLRLRLLIVEDNRDNAEMLEHLLGAMGHDTIVANGGAAALAAFTAPYPDTVLLDLGLPDIDGLEVARQMRALVPDVHLIALTGYGDPSMRARVRADGFAEHLLKPVSLDALRGALARVVPKPGDAKPE